MKIGIISDVHSNIDALKEYIDLSMPEEEVTTPDETVAPSEKKE